MTAAVALFVGVFGALIGSFLNVVIYRLPRREPLGGRERSRCPQCAAPIRWYDNVPLASFLVLRGRCRACRARIPLRYPLVEAATSGIFVLCFLRAHALGWHPVLVAALLTGAFGGVLLAASFIDAEHRLLPDPLTLRAAPAIALLAGLVSPEVHGTVLFGTDLVAEGAKPAFASLLVGATGAAIGGGVILAIRLVGGAIARKEAMGLGDVKLMAACGLLLGPAGALTAVFLALVGGSVIGGAIWLVRRSREIPFGPFLAGGTMVALLYGDLVRQGVGRVLGGG